MQTVAVAPFHPMKKPILFRSLSALVVLAAVPPALAESSELSELKAMMKAMKQTIAEQNARIATLEKPQAAPKGKAAAPAAASGRSVTVASMDVPVGELPAGAVP